jgi:hypothetical protein
LLKEKTYYYTYDGDVRLVTNTELAKESAKLQQQINVLFQGGTSEDIEGALDNIFVPMELWNTFQADYQRMSALVESLEQRLSQTESTKVEYRDDTLYITGGSERCYQQGDTIYINQTVSTDTTTY